MREATTLAEALAIDVSIAIGWIVEEGGENGKPSAGARQSSS
ncbi:hypothetical protein [Chelativorans intermedius]|uniref:Uncharacterized protein n=1 Tax=Chelativorans intermedius TaxID=515947 RepID=A0ABV6D2R0_9HYPH|nr:hypothetical protein [Chelativorans intermedius]MCT8997254.1 hypothetical protein [Chelativorans intermedius]